VSHGIYEAAKFYDFAFDFHDLEGEANAILGWVRRVLGREPRSFVELACGPAYAGIELARRGYEVLGVDLSASMCERARERGRERGVAFEVVQGDMIRLELERTFDVALCMTESLSHVLTVDDMILHLGRVAAHLRDGGVYVLEQVHPRDVLGARAFNDSAWTLERKDGTVVTAHWGSPGDPFDPIRQLRDVSLSVKLGRDGEPDEVLHDRCRVKVWTATEMEAVIRASGAFTIAERHGDFALDAPFTNDPESWRMISVLRKRACAP
jgi:SAM-dependent methyltransferase